MTTATLSGDTPSSGNQVNQSVKASVGFSWSSVDDENDPETPESDPEDRDTIPGNDEAALGALNSNNWTSWSFKQLTRLVRSSKGAVSEAMLRLIKKHMRGTKLIFVMGQSGTGKTTMLRELTGMDELKVGHAMGSGTLQYHVCPAIIDGEQYLFVDTAGFGAADLDNMENFDDIMSCLSMLGPLITMAGVLFVYGHPGNRLTVEDLRTIRWIECFCGPRFFSNVTIVTSQWDGRTEDGFLDSWGRLQCLEQNDDFKRILHPPGRFHGGALYHHGLPGGAGSEKSHGQVLRRDSAERGEELRNLIRRRYAGEKDAPLQILLEIEEGIPPRETQAAKVLHSDVGRTTVELVSDRAVVNSLPKKDYTVSPRQRPIRVPAQESAKPDSGNSSKPKEQPKQDQNWIKRLVGWLVVANEASEYFKKARKADSRKGSAPEPAQGLWSSLVNWWNGSS
ncbi:hypothetical protein F5X68DRAFT_239753 [Plectosphaerella plurivora]|uniref:G domain-containing protein n=1 Tax=Plectosphaerella plurivora TaxID=936078 RepID=A0A9P8VA65_9PEZI|nr:hypothetical protein F5X68DRAFT_239753 [Plectosphaerella plurivora]